jgi:hypothetical protein
MMEGLRPAGAYAHAREEALELVNSMETAMVRFR